MPHPTDIGPRTKFGPTASNGATAVPIGPAAVAGMVCYAAGLMFRNSAAVKHTVQLLSSGGGVLLEFEVPASPAALVIDGRAGRWESEPGEALQFKFTDGTGAAGDVIATGAIVQR